MEPGKSSFLSSSILYVLDNLIISLGGYLFWLLIPKFASASDIGNASSIVSVVALLSSFAVVGLEYPILKLASKDGKRIFGTLLTFEFLVHLAAAPLVIAYVIFSIKLSSIELILVSLSFLLLSGIAFISRNILLGILDIRKVLLFDSVSILARYTVALSLLSEGSNGVVPILAAYVAQQITIGIIPAAILIKKMGVKVDLGRLFLKDLLIDGLINFASKFSKIIISSLSIALLSLLGFSSDTIGVFYIPVIIGLAIGGFAANIATVALPTSSLLNRDYTFHSIRFSLLLVAPVISTMLVISDEFLAFINQNYAVADLELKILSIASFPFAIVMNVITFLNHNKRMKDLIKLGIIEVGLFLGTMFPLADAIGIVGVAISILIAFSGSMVIAVYWMGRASLRYSVIGTVSIFCGYMVSYVVSAYFSNTVALGIIAMSCSIAVLFATRLASISEIRAIIQKP